MKYQIRRTVLTRFWTLIFALGLLFPCTLPAQVIEKIIQGYVLIDTDSGLGNKNQILQVYRFDSGQLLHIGQVRIVEFRNGKTAASVIDVFPGFKITTGDFISRKKLDAVDVKGLKDLSRPQAAKGPSKQEKPPKQTATVQDILDKNAAQPAQPLKQPQKTATKTQNAADVSPLLNKAPAEKTTKTVRPDVEMSTQPVPGGPVVQIGIFGGPYVSATQSTLKGMSPTLGAALKFFGAGRHALLVNYSATMLHGVGGNTGESRIVSTADVLFHAGVGWFIHYDIGAGFVLDEKASISFCLGLSLDLPVFHVLTFSPNMRIYLYPHDESWEGHFLMGMNLYYTLY